MAKEQSLNRQYLASGGLTPLAGIFFSLISAALSIGLQNLLLLATRRFGGNFLPDYLTRSMLGVLYIYTCVNLALMVLKFLIKPELISFPELSSNRWYLSSRMGRPVARLAAGKLWTTYFAVAREHIFGFAVCCGYCLLAGLAFVINYLVVLLLAGLLCLILIAALALDINIFIKDDDLVWLGGLAAALMVCLLLYFSGFLHYWRAGQFAPALAAMLRLDRPGLLSITFFAVLLGFVVAVPVSIKRASRYVDTGSRRRAQAEREWQTVDDSDTVFHRERPKSSRRKTANTAESAPEPATTADTETTQPKADGGAADLGAASKIFRAGQVSEAAPPAPTPAFKAAQPAPEQKKVFVLPSQPKDLQPPVPVQTSPAPKAAPAPAAEPALPDKAPQTTSPKPVMQPAEAEQPSSGRATAELEVASLLRGAQSRPLPAAPSSPLRPEPTAYRAPAEPAAPPAVKPAAANIVQPPDKPASDLAESSTPVEANRIPLPTRPDAPAVERVHLPGRNDPVAAIRAGRTARQPDAIQPSAASGDEPGVLTFHAEPVQQEDGVFRSSKRIDSERQRGVGRINPAAVIFAVLFALLTLIFALFAAAGFIPPLLADLGGIAALLGVGAPLMALVTEFLAATIGRVVAVCCVLLLAVITIVLAMLVRK